MLFAVSPKVSTRSSACPGSSSGTSDSATRHSRSSSRFTRKSVIDGSLSAPLGLAPEQDPHHAAGAPVLEVALVVFLGAPEGLGGLDRGDDRIREALLRVRLRLMRGLGLLVRVGEDHGAILGADVGPLAVHL